MDIVQRAQAMAISPASEWPTIERESGDAVHLFSNYAAALAAIPPVFIFLRYNVFGGGGVATGLFWLCVHWLAAFVFVYALAAAIDALAPTFGAQNNRANAMKLVVFSMTPAWIAGVFALIPGFAFVRVLAALYSLYVLSLGLPGLMRPAPQQTSRYALAAVLCSVILWAVISAAVGSFL